MVLREPHERCCRKWEFGLFKLHGIELCHVMSLSHGTVDLGLVAQSFSSPAPRVLRKQTVTRCKRLSTLWVPPAALSNVQKLEVLLLSRLGMVILILGLCFSLCTITISMVAEIEIRSQISHLLKARPCCRVRVDCVAVHLSGHDFRVLQTLPCFSSSGTVWSRLTVHPSDIWCVCIDFLTWAADARAHPDAGGARQMIKHLVYRLDA